VGWAITRRASARSDQWGSAPVTRTPDLDRLDTGRDQHNADIQHSPQYLIGLEARNTGNFDAFSARDKRKQELLQLHSCERSP
jgi:hypothetical protein